MTLVLAATVAAKLRGNDPPAQLLEALLSPETSDKQWHKAADGFQALPPETAIRALYPEIAKGIPGGLSYTTYNCSDPAHDRHIRGWGRYCVANWLWCGVVFRGKGNAKVSQTVLELWGEPQSLYGREVLLAALDFASWVPEAEEPVRKLFLDSEASARLREQAAACLLHHAGPRYRQDVLAFALSSGRQVRSLLFRELALPGEPRAGGVDRSVVRMGFWLLFEELAINEERFAHGTANGSYYGAFLLANPLGAYLGEPFTPDYRAAKYQGEKGRELWYQEITENASHWWLKNKERYAN